LHVLARCGVEVDEFDVGCGCDSTRGVDYVTEVLNELCAVEVAAGERGEEEGCCAEGADV
jgi:hypothetical protein